MSSTPDSNAVLSITARDRHTPGLRLAVGLLQGLMLSLLYHADKAKTWPATEPLLFVPVLLVCAWIPVLLISGLGHLPRKTLTLWLLAATLIAAGLGLHDSWRNVDSHYPSALLWLFGAGGYFIAHVMVLAGAAEQRFIANYPGYFDNAWKLGIQIQFSVLFVGGLWLVLSLGAGLFKLIGLSFLQNLFKEIWFDLPVTVFAFAVAMHLTDVRPAIVQGIRNLLLVLLSWLLPLTVLIVGGFLASLSFTGLAHLWDTKHATALLLTTMAALVILINAAFQNGEVASEVAAVLRISARLACGLLLPLLGIAIYALGLRVADHGWTSDRLIAACCLLVAGCYALGYAWAAGQRSNWLSALAPVNIGTSFVILALLLALFSPLLDPARISVAAQVARLESGLQTADNFDFDYLKFEGGRYGLAALERLKTGFTGPDAERVREKAIQALAKKNRWNSWDKHDLIPSSQDLRTNLKVWPSGAALPDSFLTQDWSKESQSWRVPLCLKNKTLLCDVYQMGGDGAAEWLMIGREKYSNQPVLLAQQPDGPWRITATLPNNFAKCTTWLEKLKKGDYRRIESGLKDLEIEGQRIQLDPANEGKLDCQPVIAK